MPTYKHGKQTDPLDFNDFSNCMETANCYNPLRDKSFTALLYWVGCRKSEAYERMKEDFLVLLSPMRLSVDFHQRKKNGLKTPPIELPYDLPFVNLIFEQVEQTKPKNRVWDIGSTTAWNIVKNILGQKYYPHFLRLNRATHFLDDPETTVPDMKAWFGWKSSQTIDTYIGYSKRNIRRQSKRLRREVDGQNG